MSAAQIDALTHQPPPSAGEARPTMHLVVEDLLAKGDAGALKYGTQHQADNGRDHLVDAYQECLDQACYLRAEVEKRARWENDPETLEAELREKCAEVAEAHRSFEVERKNGAAMGARAMAAESALAATQAEAARTIENLREQLDAAKRFHLHTGSAASLGLVEKVQLDDAIAERDNARLELREARATFEKDLALEIGVRDSFKTQRDEARTDNGAHKRKIESLSAQLAEAQFSVEAARKLSAEDGENRLLRRRGQKALDIIASLGQGAEAPAMRELYEWLSGKRDA